MRYAIKLFAINIQIVRSFFLGLIIFISGIAYGQNKKMDSLNSLLNSAKEDTTRLRLYFALATACDIKDNLKYGEPAIALIDKLISKTFDEKEKRKLLKRKAQAIDFVVFYYQRTQDESKLLEHTQKKLNICQEIKDSACIFSGYIGLAVHYRRLGNLPEALEYFQKGLAACTELNYKEGIARFHAELADMYFDQDDTAQAIELHKKVLSIVKGMNNKKLLAQAIMKTGGLYNAIGNYATALQYYETARRMFEELNNKQGLMEVYKNSGDTYNAKGDYERSLLDLKKAVQFAEELKRPVAVVNYMGRMANVYANKSDYQSAIKCIDEAIKYNKEHIEHGDMQTWLKSRLAGIYYKQKDFRKAKQYSDMSLTIMKANNDADVAMDLEKLAAKIDSACGNYKEAYGHYQQYIILRDKLNSEEIRKAATKEKYQSEYDKKKAEDKAEQDKKDAVANEEKQKQKIIIWSVIGGLLLVMLLACFIYNRWRVTQQQKKAIDDAYLKLDEKNRVIEEKNKDILDSMRYAKRIQTSLLPTEKYISRIFNENDKNINP